MTSNQIAYAKVVEESLANRNKEALSAESNKLQAESNAIAAMNAATQRYSAEIKAQEVANNYLLQSARQAEEARHNLATEAQTAEYQTVSNQLRRAEYEQEYAKLTHDKTKTEFVQGQENARTKWKILGDVISKPLSAAVNMGIGLLGI